MPKFVIAPLTLVFLLACGSTNESQESLDAAKDKWQAAKPARYQMLVRRMCYCLNTDPVLVQVSAETVTSAIRQSIDTSIAPETLDAADYESWFTVSGLFAEVQEAIDEDAEDIDVTYDATLGYPLSIAIDHWENATDDEVGYEIREFQVLP